MWCETVGCASLTRSSCESAEPRFFADRASAFFFQRAQNAPARRVRDGVQKAIQIG